MIFQGDDRSYYGQVPWWTLSGTLEPAELVRQMDEMLSKNIREVILYANYGLEKPDFLSEEWFDRIGFIADELAKRNMACWIYDELNWPSGTAGGIIPRDYPHYRMRCLDRCEKELAPGASIQLPEGDMVRFCGYFVPDEDVTQPVDMKSLTPGETFTNTLETPIKVVILEVKLIESVFFHNIGTESTWNQPGQLDALNPEAVRCWMEHIHEKYKARFQHLFGTVIKGFFYDETTMTSVDQTDRIPWTWDLEEAFAAEYGYECCSNYWKLLYEAADAEQFRYDFWRFTGRRFADAFAKQMGDWCAENNLMLTGHGWPEEPICQRLMINSIGDLHYQQRHAQVPGTDYLERKNCFSENIAMGANKPGWAINYIYSTKHAPSTMRYNGGSRTLVESSNICGFNSPLGEQRWCYDYIFVMGLSMINSAIGFSLREFRKYACCAERAMPYYEYYRQFSDYIERSSFFNCQGLPDTQIAVLVPLSSKFSQSVITPDTSMRKEFTPFAENADSAPATLAVLETLCRSHRDFELLFEDVLLDGSVENGCLNVPRSSFKVIILPQAQVLDDQVAARLAEFTAAGGTVIAVGCTPKRTVRAAAEALQVDLTQTFNYQLDYKNAEFAAQFTGLLENVNPAPYTLEGEDARNVLTLLRSNGSWHGLWVYNAAGGVKNLRLNYPALGKPTAVFDPGDGICYRPEADGKLMLHKGQSLVLIFDSAIKDDLPEAVDAPWYYMPQAQAEKLDLNWQISKSSANTLRTQLELWHDGEFIEIEDTGFCPFYLDPEKMPQVKLRGRFVISGQVPNDLRLRFDSASFSELEVNGSAVTNAPIAEPIFDASNVAVNIAGYCRDGENVFTVVVPVCKWYGERYGICRHFVNLVKLLDPIPLAGSFGVNDQKQIVAVPAELRAGDLRDQYFPQFGGKMVLTSSFDCPEELLSAKRILVESTNTIVKLNLNGVDLGIKLWNYGNFILPKHLLKAQNNTLTMEIRNSLGNLYARRWEANLEVQYPFTLPELSLI